MPDRTSAIAAGYDISLTPFLVVASGSGVVLTRGLVNGQEDLEMALSIAREQHKDSDRVQSLVGGMT